MFILHIGRHKSGTTSLQHFLAANRDVLATFGIEYPEFPPPYGNRIAHAQIAHTLQRLPRQLQTGDLLPRLFDEVPPLRAAHERGNSSAAPTVLLSSEAFQNRVPKQIERVFPARHTRVIVYLREQVDYGVSAWAQHVHASLEKKSLSDFLYERRADFRYDNFIERWLAAFGPDRVTVRIYDRARLSGSDIRLDMLEYLRVPSNDFVLDDIDKNLSIGGSLLAIKLALNRLLDVEEDEVRAALYSPLQRLAGEQERFRSRPSVSARQQRRLRKAYRDSNERLLNMVPGLPAFEHRDLSGDVRAAPPEAFSADDLVTVLEALERDAPDFFERHLRHLGAQRILRVGNRRDVMQRIRSLHIRRYSLN